MAAVPQVLRRGALLRIAGPSGDVGCAVAAIAFLDLRFDGGRVERWLGPASLGELPGGPDPVTELRAWAVQTSDEHAFQIACDVARDYDVAPPPVDHLRCEVIVEWDRGPDLFGPVRDFAIGQSVELIVQTDAPSGADIEGGTRGIVREIDLTRPDDDAYLVAFLWNEKLTGEWAWLRAIDLFPA